MKIGPRLLLSSLTVFFVAQASAQQKAPRDPLALQVAARSIEAMGKTTPQDSTATGAVTLYVGGDETSGTVRILTRGLRQYRIETTLPTKTQILTVSRARGNLKEGDQTTRLFGPNALNDYCPHFPLAGILAGTGNSDVAAQYIGLENDGAASLHHLRFWNTFASDSGVADPEVGRYIATEVWIDAATFLPAKLSYSLYSKDAPTEPIPVEIIFGLYKSFGGILYPTQIRQNLNGTPYALIEIRDVALNTGLTNQAFVLN